MTSGNDEEEQMLLRLEEYSLFLISGNAAENTRISYERDLLQFEKWLRLKIAERELFDISSTVLDEYIIALNSSGKSSATISRAVTALKKYFNWALKSGYIFNDPSVGLESPKVIRKRPVASDNIDILKLIKAIDVKHEKGLRDLAIIRLIMSTGLSSSEILSLMLKDVNLEKRILCAGEGRRRRILRPDRKTLTALKNYITKGRPQIAARAGIGSTADLDAQKSCEGLSSPEALLFLNQNGKKMSRQGLWKNFKGYALNAGISGKITPETLRHSFAISALKAGDDIETVRKKLGHVTNSSALEYESIINDTGNVY